MARLAEDLVLFFAVALIFFIHALAIPFVVVGNSLLKNTYAYRNLVWSIVNLCIFGCLFYVIGLPLKQSLFMYSLLQLILLYNIKSNVEFIRSDN